MTIFLSRRTSWIFFEQDIARDVKQIDIVVLAACAADEILQSKKIA